MNDTPLLSPESSVFSNNSDFASASASASAAAAAAAIYRKRLVKHKKPIIDISDNSILTFSQRLSLETQHLAQSTQHRTPASASNKTSGSSTPTTRNTKNYNNISNLTNDRSLSKISDGANPLDNESIIPDHSHYAEPNPVYASTPGSVNNNPNERSYTVSSYMNDYINVNGDRASHPLPSMDYVSLTDTDTIKYKFCHINEKSFNFNSLNERFVYFTLCLYYLGYYLSVALSIYILVAVIQSGLNAFAYVYMTLVLLQIVLIIFDNYQARQIIFNSFIAEVYVHRTAYFSTILAHPKRFVIFHSIVGMQKKRERIYNFAYARLIQWKLYAVLVPFELALVGIIVLRDCLDVNVSDLSGSILACSDSSIGIQQVLLLLILVDKLLLHSLHVLAFVAAGIIYLMYRDRDIPVYIRHKLYKRVQILLNTAENQNNSRPSVYNNSSPTNYVPIDINIDKLALNSSANRETFSTFTIPEQNSPQHHAGSSALEARAAWKDIYPQEFKRELAEESLGDESYNFSHNTSVPSVSPPNLPTFHLKSPPPPTQHLAYNPPPSSANAIFSPPPHLQHNREFLRANSEPAQHLINPHSSIGEHEGGNMSNINHGNASSSQSTANLNAAPLKLRALNTFPATDATVILNDSFRCKNVGIEMLKLPHSALAEPHIVKVFIADKHTLTHPQFILTYQTKKAEKKKNRENELKLQDCIVYLGHSGGLFTQKKHRKQYDAVHNRCVSIINTSGKSLDLVALTDNDFCTLIRQIRRSQIKNLYELHDQNAVENITLEK
jgi:hypothetical protein